MGIVNDITRGGVLKWVREPLTFHKFERAESTTREDVEHIGASVPANSSALSSIGRGVTCGERFSEKGPHHDRCALCRCMGPAAS